jgi:hypothetical protein
VVANQLREIEKVKPKSWNLNRSDENFSMCCETGHTAIDVELGLFILCGIRPDHDLLCLQPQFALKGLENDTLEIRQQFE